MPNEWEVKMAKGRSDWFEAIGEFVNTFEMLCMHLRIVIAQDVGMGTQESQTKVVSLTANHSARQLGETVQMLLRRTGRMTPTEDSALRAFQDLNEQRNVIVHTPWFIGWGNKHDDPATYDPYKVVAVSPTRRVKATDAYDVRTLRIEEVREGIAEAKRLIQEMVNLQARLWPEDVVVT